MSRSRPKTHPDFPLHREEYRCLACEGLIPAELVFPQPFHPDYSQTTRTVRAVCEHCGKIYQADQILEGGIWQRVGPVSEVTAAKDRQAILAKVEERRGVRQLQVA